MSINKIVKSLNITKPPKPLSTAQALEVYKFNRYQLAYHMRNSMHVPYQFLSGLSVYHMVHTTGKYFAVNMIDGMLKHNNETEYAVIYHNCNPFNVKRAHEIRLSYRASNPDFNIEPVVLVQIVQENQL